MFMCGRNNIYPLNIHSACTLKIQDGTGEFLFSGKSEVTENECLHDMDESDVRYT